MPDPEFEVLMKIVAFVVVIALAVVFAQVEAHDGPNGCYPSAALHTLTTFDPYTQLYDDGSMDAFVCDDVAKAKGIMAAKKFPYILINQVWWKGWCGDGVLKIWVVNCNEA